MGGAGVVEDLDYNLPMNPSQLPLFQIIHVLHKISLFSENMLSLHGSAPGGMQTGSKRNRQNVITYQQQWNSTKRPTQKAMEGY